MLAFLLVACVPPGADPLDSGRSRPGDTAELPAPDLVLWNATAIDGDGRREAVSIAVTDGVIVAIGAAEAELPDGAVDATGRYVVPGLVDSHVHLALGGSTTWVGDTLANNLRAELAAGVTEVVDLGGPESLFDLRDRLAAAGAPAPHIRASGPFLTAAGSHPCETWPDPDLCIFVVDDAAGNAQASRLAAEGADLLKVAVADAGFSAWGPTPRLDLAALDGVSAAGLPVWAHVDTEADALDALAHGATVLAHPPFAAPLTDPGITGLGDARAVLTTVSAFAGVGRLLDGTLDPADPTLGLTDAQRAAWATIAAHPGLLVDGWAAANAEWTAVARENLAALDTAGVPVIPGSDAGYYFVPHGRGLHDELRELVDLGLTPRETLARATADAHALLDEPGGHLAVGEPADLLLLRDDPDADIANLQAIDAVILSGTLWTPDALATADLLPDAHSDVGDTCAEHADCITGACDGLAHACAEACATTDAPVDAVCGAGAWCMSADAGEDLTGVCRTETMCDLYAQDCPGGAYAEACIPYDEDTNACWYAGPRGEGDTCDTSSAATSCIAGLECSGSPGRCFRMCDPAAGDPCADGATCQPVRREDGSVWFGVCSG